MLLHTFVFVLGTVSLFSRLAISDEEVSELKTLCTNYFRANAVFFYVNPTVWTIGHLVPAHTQHMKEKYGFGLGLNSMEGREAKHVFISKYSQKTMFHSRWQQIFLHEFVSLVWLRAKGYNCCNANFSILSYIPKQVSNSDPAVCYCGLEKGISNEKCRFCSSDVRTKIELSVQRGKNLI